MTTLQGIQIAAIAILIAVQAWLISGLRNDVDDMGQRIDRAVRSAEEAEISASRIEDQHANCCTKECRE